MKTVLVFQKITQWLRLRCARTRYYMDLARKHRVPIAEAFRRRRYYWSWICRQTVPFPTIALIPDGFNVRRLADSGIYIIENFCTQEEAAQLIRCAEKKLQPSLMVVNYSIVLSSRRTSETATVFSETDRNPIVLPLLHRGAILCGLPYNHVEAVYVTRYRTGQKFESHTDFYSGFEGDRLYTILIYLNDLSLEEGGETIFPELNVSLRPKLGRAVMWANKDPDGSVHAETRHAALPVVGDTPKWVIQLWFRRYKMFDPLPETENARPQVWPGKPIREQQILPIGVKTLSSWPTDSHLSTRNT